MNKATKPIITLAASVIGTSLLGLLSKSLSGDIPAAYAAFERPDIPVFLPSETYGTVWLLIYAAIGFSLFFLLNVESLTKKIAPLVLFGIQMVINMAWAPIFFKYGLVWVALGLIVLLDLLVFFMVISFSRYSDISALFLIPYFFWILYLTAIAAVLVLYNI